MKLKLIFLLTLLFVSPISISAAQPEISNVVIKDIKNQKATVEWNTDQLTTSTIRFGSDQNNLIYHVTDNNFSKFHQTALTGLDKGTDYYFKIFATNEDGDSTESFLQYISTDKMVDTQAPTISDRKVVQSTDKNILFSWVTNEKSTGTLYYGTSTDALKKSVKSGTSKTNHKVVVSGLEIDSKYYFKIVAIDADKNESSQSFEARTSNTKADTELKIKNIKPQDSTSPLILREYATITFETNLASKSDISYGLDPDKLKRIAVSTEMNLIHEAELKALIPNTTYYYKISVSGSYTGVKNAESPIYSFKTKNVDAIYLSGLFHDGDFVREKSGKTIYRISGKNRIPYNKKSFSDQGFKDSIIKTITAEQLAFYTEVKGYYGLFLEGDLIKDAKKNTVYVIVADKKRPIANWYVLQYLGYGSKDIKIASSTELLKYTNGELVTDSNQIITNKKIKNNTVVKATNSKTVYLVRNNQRLPFANATAFLKRFKWSDIKTVTALNLESFAEGATIFE